MAAGSYGQSCQTSLEQFRTITTWFRKENTKTKGASLLNIIHKPTLHQCVMSVCLVVSKFLKADYYRYFLPIKCLANAKKRKQGTLYSNN